MSVWGGFGHGMADFSRFVRVVLGSFGEIIKALHQSNWYGIILNKYIQGFKEFKAICIKMPPVHLNTVNMLIGEQPWFFKVLCHTELQYKQVHKKEISRLV